MTLILGEIAETILALLSARAASSSICPSEVARQLWPDDWRAHMSEVRRVADMMRAQGLIRITQGDMEVDDVHTVRGPIRLRRK